MAARLDSFLPPGGISWGPFDAQHGFLASIGCPDAGVAAAAAAAAMRQYQQAAAAGAAAACALPPHTDLGAAVAQSRCSSPGAHCEPETLPLVTMLAPPEVAASRAATPVAGCSNDAAGCELDAPQHTHEPVPAPGEEPWLHTLVDCPYLFEPCERGSANHSGREVLITYFDLDDTTRGYCTYCPERHTRPHLLQIRRSTYHEVVKATDVSRMVDVSGIQHYVINGSKVLFLRPRPQPRPPKGVVAPARCSVDGRQLMDSGNQYCSLRCKLQSEDAVFARSHGALTAQLQDAQRVAGSDQRQLLKSVVAPRKPPAPAAAPILTGKRPISVTRWGDDADSGSDVNDHVGAGRRRRRSSNSGASLLHEAAHHHAHHHYGSRAAGHAAVPQQQHRLAVQSAKASPESPAASHDSERSSTFACRWHRRKSEPLRAPLQ